MNKTTEIIKKTVKRTFELKIIITGILLCLAHFILSLNLAYSEPLRIAVLPFEINAEQNLDFLQKGIQDMLGSRLSFKDQVVVIDKESVKKAAETVKGFSGESLALLVGGQLKADFVIHGSLTIIGNNTSIDSKLIDVSGKNPPISFFRETAEPGGVIPAINQFATTINETIFNRPSGATFAGNSIVTEQPIQTKAPAIAATSSSTTSPSLSNRPLSGQQLNTSFTTNIQGTSLSNQHSNQHSNQQFSQDSSSSPNPEFSVTNSVRGKSEVWKSHTFNHLINGIAIADIDNDNLIETVFISDNAVYIYRFAGNSFIKVAETPKNRLSNNIAVSVGDINGNGKDEIFVTSLNPDKNQPNSFVIEFDGSKYVEIIKSYPWYFRVVEAKDKTRILLGQKQKSKTDDIYASPIYKMIWDGNKYAPAEKILESGKANVLGVLFDDVISDNTMSIIGYDKDDHLTLFKNNGGVMWRDVNMSGGNTNYFVLPKESPTDDNPLQYFPSSVRSYDVNGDGMVEILYSSNSDITKGYLSKFKKYSKGIIHCGFWNNSGLSLQWSTPEQTGRISDFVIGDFDNDGKNELIISNITKESLTTFTNSESLIIAYDLMQ